MCSDMFLANMNLSREDKQKAAWNRRKLKIFLAPNLPH